MKICKYCKCELQDIADGCKSVIMNENGYYYVCSWDGTKIIDHEPMDNLDYIEYLAKLRNLG